MDLAEDRLRRSQPVIFKDGMFIALGGSGQVYSSPDGISWQKRTADPNLGLSQLVGGSETSAMMTDTGLLFTSSGYRNWRRRTSPFTYLFQPRFVGFGNNTFLAGDNQASSLRLRTAGTGAGSP